MKTIMFVMEGQDVQSPGNRERLSAAAAILRQGGTVAFPTETVYGLGANATDASAVEKIFAAKQRPHWDPLIVHVINHVMLDGVSSGISSRARALMQAFWPGPLTLLLPRAPTVPPIVTAGRDRVGVRWPSHPVAAALIEAAGVPIAAPSANRFGRTSPTRAEHVLEDLDGRIDAIVDAGESAHGLESTVIDICADPPLIYRPGVITLEQVQAICPDTRMYKADDLPTTDPNSLPAPGVGIRHYAPRARLELIDADANQVDRFHQAIARATQAGECVGLMLPDSFASRAAAGASLIYRWGAWSNEEELAQRLFAGLRHLDAAGATVIFCPIPSGQGIGVAIRDRLMKASRQA